MITIKTVGQRHYIAHTMILSADCAAVLKFLYERKYACCDISELSDYLNMPIKIVEKSCEYLWHQGFLKISNDKYYYDYTLSNGIKFDKHYDTYEEAKAALNFSKGSWL